ncbi:LysR family transcriptional regulator [Hydrogenophaga aromaticivorans]|uniref:LysR family transcriptional regulator n=1 Tax=Hydrogenophaga aromaticivorans TaxID=2610898 RepID=UPI001B3896FA|nr:LysR family transcriptional regulator [Hydrogenophaga aromaticivorans]MBQ0917349.1 LysR family transcriptional regulator [Hydrogenophaga aromaticivorans]
MNTHHFNWNLVPAFLAAHEHGSLLAAARALGSSQPTVGRHISELEAQLGTVLFERTGRGLAPTPAGLRLAEAARAMESGALALLSSVGASRSTLEGTVRISASQPVACVLLPPLLAQLRQTLPGIQVELVASNAVSNLLRREADIALRMVRPVQASLVARRIGQVGLSACAHRDYLARRGTPAEPADLLQHDLVGNDQVMDIPRGFAALGHDVPRERLVLRTDDLMAYWSAVRAGMGIGFVADYLLRTDPAVQRVLPQLRIPPLPIWLTVHREIRSSARIRAVYDFLAQAVPQTL